MPMIGSLLPNVLLTRGTSEPNPAIYLVTFILIPYHDVYLRVQVLVKT
jgi:hypothetical protein